MDILKIPFHYLVGINNCLNDEFIYEIDEKPEYLNHLGTIHACMQLTLAEATAGEFLLREFKEYESAFIPVVRRTNAKYNKPANGKLCSKAAFFELSKSQILDELNSKNRCLLKINVEIFDAGYNKTLSVIFDWFITKKTT
ncbi:MAG: DUF4442 domain-containing protein [bacterium]|nr:DUF4442 domain-containing protein [bacterium]